MGQPNLRHLAAQREATCFLAHVRSVPGHTVSEQDCPAFVHEGHDGAPDPTLELGASGLEFRKAGIEFVRHVPLQIH